MRNNRDLWDVLANAGIYLTEAKLKSVNEDYKRRLEAGESVFKILYDLESNQELKKYNDPAKGAFVIDNKVQKSKKRVLQKNSFSDVTIAEFPSVYAATKSLGLARNCNGNIKKAADKNMTCYGFRWSFIEEEEEL